MLTNEDHLIFRARTNVATQAGLHKADRVDASNASDWMRYRTIGFSWSELAQRDVAALELIDAE